MFGISWIEWFGYFASLLVAVSLLMTSTVKLRWFNLAGSICFAYYGFVIGAIPVAVINLTVVFINIYHLYRIYNTKKRVG